MSTKNTNDLSNNKIQQQQDEKVKREETSTPMESRMQPIVDQLKSLFTPTNILFIVGFLIAYFIIVSLFKTNEQVEVSDTKLKFLRIFDMAVLAIFTLSLGLTYFSKTAEQKDAIVKNIWSDLIHFVNDPVSLFSLGLFIFILYLAIYILGIPMDVHKPVTINLAENISWILFVSTGIIVFFNKVLGISVTDFIQRMWKSFWNIKEKPATDLSSNVITTPKSKDEVFHVSNNLYSYDDAQSICSSFGSRLATYDEIEKAYNEGAEWCSYGWSDGQMAFFPTQKETWDKLQKTSSHKNDCGRPGVNGGYMANPELHFGVNCYGVKPAPTDANIAELLNKKDMPIPKNAEDVALDKKVQYWKDNKDKLLQLSSFNNEKWSAY